MSIIKIYHNKYDIYILLLIVSTIFGTIGGALTAPRLLGILLIPKLFNIANREKLPYITTLRSWTVAFFIFASASLLWTPDKAEGLKELLYYSIHFLIFFEIIVFSRMAISPLRNISFGVILCIFLTSVVGFWELTTDNHLSYSAQDEAIASTMNGEVVVRYFAAVTFYNLNGYVTYLCLFFPFLLYGMTLDEKLIKILSVIAMLIAIVLILCNASRGGLLSIFICLFLFFLIATKSKSILFSIFLLISGLSLLLYKFGDSILLIISMRTSEGGLFSDDSRFVIWANALNVFFDYVGIGCGIGGMREAMAKFANGGITITHNIFLEILCQYGLVFCLAFVKFLLNLLKNGKKSLDKKRSLLVKISVLSFPMTCIINSGYLLDPQLFIVLASIYVFANYERIRVVY